MGSETPEADIEDIKIMVEIKTQQLPSLMPRSSSSRASLEPDNKDVNNPQNDSIPRSKSEGDLSRERGTISSPPSPSHTPQWSMVSSSPTVGIHSSQTTSPPLQTMISDPDRIPASVFSKPANTSEWSMASNDSLFSIHNSVNKDQSMSGELDELNPSPSLYVTEAKPNELRSLPPLMEVPSNEEDSAKSSSISTYEKEDGRGGPSTPQRLSNESGHGTTSFAFPVLGADGGKTRSMERVVEEKPEVQTQEANATQEADTTRGWFSCCRCC